MSTSRYLAASLALTLGAACTSTGSDRNIVTDPIPCRADNCGKDNFRSAIPSRQAVLIDLETSQAANLTSHKTAIGSIQRQLQSVAPYYLFLATQVDEINDTVDDIFTEIELVAATEPEIADDDIHRWRVIDPDDEDFDIVLTLTTDDDVNFTLDYAIVPAGLEPAISDILLYGDVTLDDSGLREDFALVLDFDIATGITPSIELTGALTISSMPFPDGVAEIWYDYTDFGELGGETFSSLTTYWLFEEGSGALEYIDTFHDEAATIYARWDDLGGRLDYHLGFTDDIYGPLDEISTGCWDVNTAEVFYAWALIDSADNYTVELDGFEEDCDFGVLSDHPNPNQVLVDNLPGDGEWDDLADLAIPFCEDDPDAVGCIAFCDLFPSDLTCAP